MHESSFVPNLIRSGLVEEVSILQALIPHEPAAKVWLLYDKPKRRAASPASRVNELPAIYSDPAFIRAAHEAAKRGNRISAPMGHVIGIS